jgi:hypothetical protein
MCQQTATVRTALAVSSVAQSDPRHMLCTAAIRKQHIQVVDSSNKTLSHLKLAISGCCAMQSGRNLPFEVIALMMEAASNSETLVNFYQTTW